jgi:HAD superfamily hydrolase (TIGR01509 family)
VRLVLPPRALCFDAGQTLLELDLHMLATRVGERGVVVREAELARALPAAWAAYDAHVAVDGPAPWHVLMTSLLHDAGAPPVDTSALVDWLWAQQPVRNLWRRPVPGMIEMARAARAAGLGVAIISNSEGRLAELIAEVGWAVDFPVIADSGALGVEKPARAIFDWTFAQLGVRAEQVVHIGDSWAADVEGARRVGARAIWFGRGAATRTMPDGVASARDADEVRAALRGFGVPW